MCNYLVFLTVISLKMGDYFALSTQTIEVDKQFIKNIALDGKGSCKFEKSDQLVYNLHLFDNCENRVLPIVDKDFFINKEHILCVAFYEAISGICDFNFTTSQMIEIEDAKKSAKICDFSHNLFDQINITHKNIKMNGWYKYVKDSMSNTTVCQSICVFLNRVDPKCTMLMKLFHYYTELSSKKVITQKPNNVSNSVKELTSVVQNTDKDTSITASRKLPSHSDQVISQTTNEVKTESVEKPTNSGSITVPAQNSELPEENKVGESVQDQPSVKPDEISMPDLISKPVNPPVDVQPEDIKGNEPSVDVLDKDVEGIPPSSEKDFLAGNSFDENKLLDNKVDVNSDDTRLTNQLTNPDQDTDMIAGEYMHDNFKEAEDSNFFVYFLVMTGGCIVAYVLFHNRNKLLALALEGRKGRSARARGGGGRHSSASYSKLHSNLEEAIASNTTPPSANNVLY